MTLKLYGTYTSPYVRHCRIALIEARQPHELVQTDYEQSAAMSPTRRVPFLHEGRIELHDSLSILRFIRERAGQSFFPDLNDFDLFAMVNTALDTAVNVFLLERDGIGPADSDYLARQTGRVSDLLALFEQRLGRADFDLAKPTDGQLRLGCFLAWGLFRERLALDDYPALTDFLARLDGYAPFADTRPKLA